ncbi:mgc81809 protein [Niveomyces insectorum RCEF 264]|uniref:Mgc81809 protein n=1 Tax=Niveomyces insectorum RCEF 264 TaxID=1081102 RepID=A0A167T870_9HYPO|nr:mgc81809 protein [Niveomyces insectorum RCEF 264]
METARYELSPPSLEEVAKVLASALPRNYAESSVEVVDCPDLRKPPFYLATEGLGGRRTIADVGGQPNLFPRPRRDKNYSLIETAKLMKLDPDRGSLIGAGAAPNHVHGINSELAPNLSWQGGFDHNVNNLSRSVRIVPGDAAKGVADSVGSIFSGSTECSLMVNVYGSLGLPGPVIKVTARGRRGTAGSISEFMRTALRDVYGADRQVSLGGVFVLKSGRANFHVMPDFPSGDQLPFKDRKAVDSWLTFHHFAAPIVCLSTFHSADLHNLGLRMEHTHCFSVDKPVGGHYHYDLVGEGEEEVEYEGYFNVADTLVRIDQPKN